MSCTKYISHHEVRGVLHIMNKSKNVKVNITNLALTPFIAFTGIVPIYECSVPSFL